jgi:hypothetical protein
VFAEENDFSWCRDEKRFLALGRVCHAVRFVACLSCKRSESRGGPKKGGGRRAKKKGNEWKGVRNDGRRGQFKVCLNARPLSKPLFLRPLITNGKRRPTLDGPCSIHLAFHTTRPMPLSPDRISPGSPCGAPASPRILQLPAELLTSIFSTGLDDEWKEPRVLRSRTSSLQDIRSTCRTFRRIGDLSGAPMISVLLISGPPGTQELSSSFSLSTTIYENA